MSWMLMFPRLIPSPFYTRRCLCAQAGTWPAARFPTRCHATVVVRFYRRNTVGGMATAAKVMSVGSVSDRRPEKGWE